MAAIAALGQRNQGSDNAALIAALGTRNEHRGDDGFGLGGGGGGILGLLAILGLLRGRGGLGGGEDCGGDGDHGRTAILQTLMEGQADLRAQVPTIGLELQNSIEKSVAALALGTQQGFANTKDAVQNLALYLSSQLATTNQNVSSQGCQTREVVQATSTAIMNKIDENRIRELETELLRTRGRHDAQDVEFRITQSVNQNNQQQQSQWQTQRFDDERYARQRAEIFSAFNQSQRTRSDNDVVNFGTMAASGNQSSQNTQVR
jgi:hypothetical protein